MKSARAQNPVLTIGHSTRSLGEFLAMLEAHGVEMLVDVRTMPRSRRNPQFNKDTLPKDLRKAGIGYRHMAGLGGLRHARADSPNKAWRNLSFRGYADYMQTPEFRKNLAVLMELARKRRIALMCAEAVPWRCHRSMIADALVMWGFEVEHIMTARSCRRHMLRPWAVVKRKRITYPLAAGSADEQGGQIAAGKPADDQKGATVMGQAFKVGDHVSWNSEAGRVRGTIKKRITSPMKFKGYTVRASKEEPQYLIKSDKTDHMAMHKGSALRRLGKPKS